MSVAIIIKEWTSDKLPESRSYLIVKELIKYYNKMPDNNLVNLYLIDESFNNFGWYIDKTKGIIYNVNLFIDNKPLSVQNISNNNDILDVLKYNNYTKLNFYLTTLKRNQLVSKNNFNSGLIIYINTNSPEYFKLSDVKSEEKSINKPSRKRKAESNIEQPNKKIKIDNINWSEMISASSLRNYFLNDTIIDWLKEYHITSIHDIPNNKKGNSRGTIKYNIEDSFTQYIMEQGVLFEEKVMEVINKKHNVVKVGEAYQAKEKALFLKTIEYMKEGKNIIYQGILHNYKNKTFGAPDLMIRSDYINKFIGYNVYNDNFGSVKLNKPWHYVIVDIKHSTILLNSDGINIRNQDSIPAYKGQLLVYTQALNEIQGTNVTKAFIMGKKYMYENKGKKYFINNYMNKLGTIDYAGFDSDYINKLKDGINWIHKVRKEGHTWKLLPMPTKDELFPNMKNDRDGAFRTIKKKLSEEISDITSVTYCGIDKRKIAFGQGIYSWSDPRCTTKNMGFKESNLSKRIDAILKINRQNEVLVLPNKIEYNKIDWRKRKEHEMEFFLDYETMNSNFDKVSLENLQGIELIFMIGVGFNNKENNWEFKSFILEEKTKESERKMLDDFWLFINGKLKEYNKKESVFIHWSQAEKIVYEKIQLRHLNLENKKLIDLYQVFINEPIVVKGALNYSLKTIANALNKNDLIKVNWNSSNPCSNGLNAMIMAIKCYEKNKKISNAIPTIKNIEEYNEVDCKSLYEILNYLRKHH